MSDFLSARTLASEPAATTSPRAPGARPHVDHVIRTPDGLLVVLDHQHSVAQVAQALERLKQLLIVARVQANARLVENVQHTDQPGANLRSQPIRCASLR